MGRCMIYIPTPEEVEQLLDGKHPLQITWDKKKEKLND